MDILKEADTILHNKQKRTRRRVLVVACPICGKEASSIHHIKPLPPRGTGEDIPVNRVILCKSCHDIIEQIYDETGMEYCPALVYHLRLELDNIAHNTIKRIEEVTERPEIERGYTFPEEKPKREKPKTIKEIETEVREFYQGRIDWPEINRRKTIRERHGTAICSICGDEFWKTRPYNDKHCSNTCRREAGRRNSMERSPLCQLILEERSIVLDQVTKRFGYKKKD